MSELSGNLLLGNTYHPEHDSKRLIKNIVEFRTWSRRLYAREFQRLANDRKIEILVDRPRRLSLRNPRRAYIKYRTKNG